MPSDSLPNEPELDEEEITRNIIEWVEIDLGVLAAGAVSAVRYNKWEKGTLYKKKKGRKAKATAFVGPTYLPSGAGVGAVGKF